MRKTLAEIAKLVDGEVVGNPKLVITGLNGLVDAKEGELTFFGNPKYISLLKTTKASAILTSRNFSVPGKAVIKTENPSLAFAKIAAVFHKTHSTVIKGIHKTAVIAKGVKLGKNVAVGAHVVVEEKVTIGDNTIIQAGTFIGNETKIGKNCIFYPNVTIYPRMQIANRVIIHSGTVIGSDGFGYEELNGVHQKIPQMGIVFIEDDVEIGANVAIDRARFDKTFIGRGTKIDNLVQIAHNVQIGEDCLIVAQVGISGSVIIEKGAILAGQSGVVGHIHIGEKAIIAAQAGVTKAVQPFTKVFGYPARPYDEAMRSIAAVQRLPYYAKMIQELKQKVEKLEAKLK